MENKENFKTWLLRVSEDTNTDDGRAANAVYQHYRTLGWIPETFGAVVEDLRKNGISPTCAKIANVYYNIYLDE